jgi:hypothetical protein
MRLRWLTVDVETGATNRCCSERSKAEDCARLMAEDYGSTWLVVEVASVHGPSNVSIPSAHMAQMRQAVGAAWTLSRRLRGHQWAGSQAARYVARPRYHPASRLNGGRT